MDLGGGARFDPCNAQAGVSFVHCQLGVHVLGLFNPCVGGWGHAILKTLIGYSIRTLERQSTSL